MDSSNIEKDPLDDFFGNSEPNHPKEWPEQTIEEENKLLEEPEEVEASKPVEELEEKEASEPLEESEDEIKPLEEKEEVYSDSDIEEPPVTKPKTNLKKSMERSFEDLLTGLSDESEPELDDMIVADIDNTNLERRSRFQQKSLLETPDKSHRDSNQQTSNKFSTPNKPLDLDLLSSTPMDRSTGSPEVKVTTPDVKVITPDDKEEWIDRDDASFNENDVVMRPKKEYVADYADGDDVDLEAIEDTNHLDVDVNKHKSALGKKGSLALRRKPSRKSRKSLLSSGDDAIFQDSTDSKPVSMTNGNDDDDDDNDDDGYDLSPPAKKPSPAVMLPLPGMARRPPSQRKSSMEADNDDNAMDTKEVKRSSKPPPGAFVLPSFSPSPAKPKRSPSDVSDRPTVESKPAVFEKPALRSVKPVEKSPSPDQDKKPAFSRAGLRSSNKPETVTKDVSQERDITFQKPALRSTPKPRREKSPEENMDIGVFEKPQLRSTPKPKLEQKFTDDKDNDIFEQTNLRSVQKQETNNIKETDSDKHVFEKPSLRNTGRKIENDIDNVKEETHTKTFEKPALRTTNKLPRADSVTDHSEPVHTFDKPPLRSTSRPSVDKQTDSSSTGVFEKPSLKKTTPSPEKEVKDLNEPKGMFDKPALRKTERERKESPKLSEKPEWLQQAANKHSKVLGAVHTKENSHNSIDKETPSWLEKPVLRKTRGQPLQDSSNGQSTTSSHSDLSHNDDSSKQVSTPRSRNSSMSSESEHEKRSTPASTVKESHNNYTPSWMRQTRSPSVPTPGVLGPAKSLPSLSGSGEVPAWKRELAQRRQSRKEKTPEEIPKTETSAEPEWKKGIQLRKTRNTPQPKEVKSVEPEWKKAAEERHARLRNSTVHDKADQ
ncbi:microtubule-associated protein 4-like isoform X2 [Ruditapes philippinarum]|uniref:microtubule-associated protein 4-like isoform X2 n=1 Tax=Ruditapes philippinarum TaxID=129788 RepID=UPI00295A7AD7|nr:microtubule-associated protein 4-like isoform X2 [Ruditapes philippinarum]